MSIMADAREVLSEGVQKHDSSLVVQGFSVINRRLLP